MAVIRLYGAYFVWVFQGTARRLREPDSEAGFPRQMARRRREGVDVSEVRAARHMARCTGVPPSAR